METGKNRVWLGERNLYFDFPNVHPEARLRINFRRTLRVPDDGRDYPLPASLGSFPLLPVQDYADSLPPVMQTFGGVMLPMYQSEATWLNFDGRYPIAVKIAAGKINAVTGDNWQATLNTNPQDYITTPKQPWLDGFCVEKGTVRQFVAMPLGEGYTAEEQLTGKAEFGGLQIQAYPMKREFYDEWQEKLRRELGTDYDEPPFFFSREIVEECQMGYAPGGKIVQDIYDDPHGVDAWDFDHSLRCFVHAVNSAEYLAITGHQPPHPPISKKEYQQRGLPWFEIYEREYRALKGSSRLAGLKSLAQRSKEKNLPIFDNVTMHPDTVELLESESND